MLSLSDLPTLNAALNGTSAILLSLGYYFIRQREIEAHKRCMLAAVTTSTLFLISYLTYHLPGRFGSVHFMRTGWIRVVYFSILTSHTILAAVIVPLVLITLSRAWKAQFDRHRRIAHWTLPLWVYVSVTGVIIYWMLYHQ